MMTAAARDPQMVADAPVLARLLARNAKLKFSGSVWRLGRQALTKTDGEPTSLGHAYLAAHPDASLSHFDRATQRFTGKQVRARDMGGRMRVVATMVDGKLIATPLGQSFYGAGAAVFRAYAPGGFLGNPSIVIRSSSTRIGSPTCLTGRHRLLSFAR